MNNIRIVPMTADHLDALEQLERTCFSRPWSRKMLAEELDNECAAFLVAEDAATGEVTVVHRLTSDAATSAHFPQPYAVELRSRFGATLEVSLTTTNTGPEPFEIEEALQTVGYARKD